MHSGEQLTLHSVLPCCFGKMLTSEPSLVFLSKRKNGCTCLCLKDVTFTCLLCSRTSLKTTDKQTFHLWREVGIFTGQFLQTFTESLGKYDQTMLVSAFQQAIRAMNSGLNHIDLENSSNTKEHVNM